MRNVSGCVCEEERRDSSSIFTKRKSLFCLCAIVAAFSFGCSDSGDKDNSNDDETVDGPFVFVVRSEDESVTRTFEMNSQAGCALDSDCASGMFCFHGLCTNECSESNPCAKGTCSAHGRCLVSKTKNSILRDLKDDLNEAKASDVIEQIPGAEVLYTPEEKVFVKIGASSVTVTLTTLQDYGTISYTVSKPEEDTVTSLMQSTPKVDEKTGMAVYSFKIPANKSSLGDQGEFEIAVLDTSVGSYEIGLAPRKPAAGLYEGVVRADQFGGVDMPIRFIIETKPTQITSFEDIKGLTIYLPSSGADLFSPEIVEDAAKTTWSKVVMKQEKASNCMGGDKCWSANYSTNDFTFPQSGLLNADQKVNRAIRIEVAGYDDNSMMFDGNIRDILAGTYREVDNKGKMQWAKATMDGLFIVSRKEAFNKTDYTLIDHKKQTEKLRDLTTSAADVCTDADVKKLMEFAGEGCESIADLAGYKEAENAQTCLLAAASGILSSEHLVSKIIEKLITKEASDLNPVEGFASLQDFMKDCANDNGICAERHEIVCAVDLLGRSYQTSDETNKVEILESWHQLMRESYLGPQYSAWQNDVEVRRKWLENASAPTFLASVLEKINTDMLKSWEEKVFAAHRNVLAKQFSQTSLEVLTRVDTNSTIVSDRDLILAEFTDGWSGVSDSMALGLRRYDALYQGTEQRMNKAAEMRPYLFDLYYSGLVETAINRATKNGSLNASYGKNLYENVARLRSLGQSFDDLVFMRDAEVVTSTSLDPLSGNAMVLSDRKALAKETVAAAQARRDKVFDDYDQKTIDKAQINAMLSDTIESLQTELVSLCGLPRGCVAADNEKCAPLTAAGFCGFDLPADTQIPGSMDKAMDSSSLNADEITQYYSNGSYKIGADTLSTILTESDIRAMSEAERNDLLCLSEADFKGKKDDQIADLVDERISEYLAAQKAQLEYALTDYYSLTNTGEAAEAILAYRTALKDVDIAQADYIALNNKVTIARSTCESYASNIETWDSSRKTLLATIQKNIEVINSHYDNITQAERDKIKKDLQLLEDQYTAQNTYVNTTWYKLAEDYKNDQNTRISTVKDLTNACTALEFSTDTLDRARDTATSFWEDPDSRSSVTGVSQFGYIQGFINVGCNAAAIIMQAVELGLQAKANNLQATIDKESNIYEFESTYKELKHELEQQELELKLQRSLAVYQPYDNSEKCKAASETECHAVVTCECPEGTEDIYSEVSCPKEKQCSLKTKWYVMGLDQWILSEQNAIDTLDEVNDTLRELFEVNDAYQRDLQDLEFKRSEYLQLAQDLLVKREHILKAQLNAYSALKHYYSIVQRALALQSQYDAASARLGEINNLYAAPATIFAFASDLETVESKIDLAKERIYDYLSAAEYLAVRPFVDLRRATYLARSTNDLDAIIDQIDTVVAKCGGGTPSVATVDISAREMMGITQDFASMSMGERFQSVIAKGNIPINSLTRYTVDSTVRDLVKKGLDLRSGTFAVTIDKSMNLATTCNAKIDSIAVQIVGENIIKEGAGENVHPTITVFYDGQTQLVSCQPNIAALVSTIGDKTSYGKYSTFTIEPTKISPNAGINDYGEPNVSLAGKPFATSYTVLIDTQVSENSKIDWDKVEDIKLQVKYTYYDLFPNSSACVSL